MKLSRPAKPDPSAPCPTPEVGAKLAERFPATLEFLSCERWDDGAARERGTLMLMWEGGFWKAWVNDKDSGRSAFVSGSSLELLAAAVERGLSTGALDWRSSRGAAAPQRKRS